MNNESDNDQPIPEASASKENTIPERAASPERIPAEEESNQQLPSDEDEGAESPVVKRTRELLESEPGFHPPPDPRVIDPQSALGKMFAAMNPGSIIPSTPDEIAQAAFFARLREQDDMPEPSDTYQNRPPRTAADLREGLKERLHPHVEGPIETREILLSQISNGNFENCRRSKDTEERAALKASMASKTGLLNAIVVCRDPHDPEKFHPICGYTRLELARELGWNTIRCTIREVHGERDALLMNLSENLARSNLTPYESAAQIELICRRFLVKPEEVAKALALSVRHVYSMLRYMSVLPPDVISRLEERASPPDVQDSRSALEGAQSDEGVAGDCGRGTKSRRTRSPRPTCPPRTTATRAAGKSSSDRRRQSWPACATSFRAQNCPTTPSVSVRSQLGSSTGLAARPEAYRTFLHPNSSAVLGLAVSRRKSRRQSCVSITIPASPWTTWLWTASG